MLNFSPSKHETKSKISLKTAIDVLSAFRGTTAEYANSTQLSAGKSDCQSECSISRFTPDTGSNDTYFSPSKFPIKHSRNDKIHYDAIYASANSAVGGYNKGIQSGALQDYTQLTTETSLKSSEEYKALIRHRHPIVVIAYIGLLILSPLVFRYAISSFMYTKIIDAPYPASNNNVSLSMSIPLGWKSCESCVSGVGFTLPGLDIIVDIRTVNHAQFSGINRYSGPYLSVFASNDFTNWYNFYSPQSPQTALIMNSTTKFNLNQTLGLGCLGSLQASFIVACVSNQAYSIAATSKVGQFVNGPPFNDRCEQVFGICGINCVELKFGQFPWQCPDGIISQELIDNRNATSQTLETEVVWMIGITAVDWVVLIVIFLDAFNQILRFLPIISGTPTEFNEKISGETVVRGRAVLATVSPFASESEGIFLRSLIGRTATALHTAGSKHQIQGLYIDMISNEDASNVGRYEQWRAWLEFIEFLCSFKTEEMDWKSTWRKPNPKAPRRSVTVELGISMTYLCDPAAVDFIGCHEEGVRPSISTSTHENRGISVTVNTDCDEQSSNVFEVKMAEILPAICFLDGWLEQIKSSEATWPNYFNVDTYRLALQCVFNSAPCQKYFSGDNLVKVHAALERLYDAFDKSTPSRAPKAYIYRDFDDEYSWKISRGDSMPLVDIAWIFFSRSKLNTNFLPRHVTNCTKCAIDSIVFLKPTDDIPYSTSSSPLDIWLDARTRTYQILCVDKPISKQFRVDPLVTLSVWPPSKQFVGEPPAHDDCSSDKKDMTIPEGTITIELSKVELITRNRGKAGALNTCLEYVRRRADEWTRIMQLDDVPSTFREPIPLLFSIVDARHMLVEPEIFWNSSLTYFSCNKHSSANESPEPKKSSVILVQYPQHFSNVGNDNYLDNNNSCYYVISQTLRDCAKVMTSSGTNAIWDVSDKNFKFATCCRIEDTATTQNCLEKYSTIHLPVFVAHGIAKDTKDYIEALYRWSAGATELFWWTITQLDKIHHYIIIGTIFTAYSFAGFVPDARSYYAWLGLVSVIAFLGLLENQLGQKPFRALNVSATIVMNTMQGLSNLTSPVWLIIIPSTIAFNGFAPLARTASQALTWAFVSIIIKVLQSVIIDQFIVFALFLNPKLGNSKKFNFTLELWRATQLFSCSFAFSFMSIIGGTVASFKGYFCHQDNTFWDSFRNPNGNIFIAMYNTLLSPNAWTRVLALLFISFQMVCILTSAILNQNNPQLLLMSIVVCGFNMLLVLDIALIMIPVVTKIHVFRPEYFFAVISLTFLIGAIFSGMIPYSVLQFDLLHQEYVV